MTLAPARIAACYRVRFGISGPLRYTFDAEEAATAAEALGSARVVPLHHEGWTHFREPRARAEQVFAHRGLADRVRWLVRGERTAL